MQNVRTHKKTTGCVHVNKYVLLLCKVEVLPISTHSPSLFFFSCIWFSSRKCVDVKAFLVSVPKRMSVCVTFSCSNQMPTTKSKENERVNVFMYEFKSNYMMDFRLLLFACISNILKLQSWIT